jgi:hypothetical protein
MQPPNRVCDPSFFLDKASTAFGSRQLAPACSGPDGHHGSLHALVSRSDPALRFCSFTPKICFFEPANAAGESGKDGYDEFSLPTGSCFIEDLLKAGTRRLISDAQFDCSGPKCFSCNEMKC